MLDWVPAMVGYMLVWGDSIPMCVRRGFFMLTCYSFVGLVASFPDSWVLMPMS